MPRGARHGIEMATGSFSRRPAGGVARRNSRIVGPLALAALLVAAVGCTSLPGSGGSTDLLRRQAQAALARWDAAGTGIVFVGELTQQVGDWEEALGSDGKIALMAGRVEAATPLSTSVPDRGQVRWKDGATRDTDVLSAASALAEIRASAGGSCGDCRTLRVTRAQLTSATFETSRGPATAPAWAFDLEGTAVRILRIAVAARAEVVPPSWDPMAAPVGISIDAARLVDERHLVVSFVGAPDPASKACGADYTTEAVESRLAVVVIVIEHRNPTLVACSAVGAIRTAEVALASALGDRVVLEVRQGLPVAVTRSE